MFIIPPKMTVSRGFQKSMHQNPEVNVMIAILTKNLEPSPRRFSRPEIELWEADCSCLMASGLHS
jgi:hypothetical protein